MLSDDWNIAFSIVNNCYKLKLKIGKKYYKNKSENFQISLIYKL
jgi:hypothetical protein